MQHHQNLIPLNDGALSVSVYEPISPRLTLLCVHGWTLDARSFSGQHVLAEQGVRVVTFDRRGFGVNELTPGLDQELEDIDHLLHHLPGPIYAFGVSQGARLLLRYAARPSATLRGLIVQGGLVDGLPSEQNEIPYGRYASLLEAGDHEAFAREWLAHPLMRSGVPASKLSAVADLIRGYEGRDLRGSTPRLVDQDLTGVLPQVFSAEGLSLWVIEAEQESETRRAHARFLIEDCGARGVPMPGGHLCHFTHPDVFNERLLTALGVLGHGANCGE